MYAWLSQNGANSVPLFFLFFFFHTKEQGHEAVEKLIPSPPRRSVNEFDPYNKIRILPNVVLRSSYPIGCISDRLSLN